MQVMPHGSLLNITAIVALSSVSLIYENHSLTETQQKTNQTTIIIVYINESFMPHPHQLNS